MRPSEPPTALSVSPSASAWRWSRSGRETVDPCRVVARLPGSDGHCDRRFRQRRAAPPHQLAPPRQPGAQARPDPVKSKVSELVPRLLLLAAQAADAVRDKVRDLRLSLQARSNV